MRPRLPDASRGVDGAPGGRGETRRTPYPGAAEAAVASGILGQVLLVVVLGVVERRGGDDLGRDRAVARGRERLLVGRARGLRGAPLGRRVTVDRRAVLRADVVTLPHPLGGVVALPEQTQERLVAGARRVEDHPDHLGVPRAPGAHLLVG